MFVLKNKQKASQFDGWYGSWFKNHYRIMSRLQRKSMNTFHN